MPPSLARCNCGEICTFRAVLRYQQVVCERLQPRAFIKGFNPFYEQLIGIHDTHLSAGTVAAIVSVVAVLLLIFAGTIFLLRRRRLQRQATERDPIRKRLQTGTISPFILLTQADADGTMPRQQPGSGPQAKMIKNGDGDRLATLEPRPNRRSDPTPMRATSPDVEAQLRTSRDQMNMLMMRITRWKRTPILRGDWVSRTRPRRNTFRSSMYVSLDNPL
ncbi:hypothetical protein B0H19DRAFT_1258544 [Mycena capillaripes]|nr:hypothetical protein B0H19DRAFT_1258544 [Mycena capillaripes]